MEIEDTAIVSAEEMQQKLKAQHEIINSIIEEIGSRDERGDFELDENHAFDLTSHTLDEEVAHVETVLESSPNDESDKLNDDKNIYELFTLRIVSLLSQYQLFKKL